ncbi:MAG: CBS domain-containing protein [Bacteroidales bacterium]|nr:CBS domain-containing protein [Bacteroidales bacterium]MDD3989431.1 CBS domain-containing protein [Bacteroidales bacterium]MDD4638253.1 CBS domain-containing protein [Bacteroidales bacterium]
MSDDYFSQGIALIIILFSYLVLKCAEALYFAITISDRESLKAEGSEKSSALLNRLTDNDILIRSVLQADTFFTVTSAVISFSLFIKLMGTPESGLFWKTLAVVVIVMIFLRCITAIAGAERSKENYLDKSKRFTWVYSAMIFFASPVNNMFRSIERLFSKTVRERNAQSLEEIVEITDENDSREVEEKRLLKGIVDLPNKVVSRIMKPRVEIFSLDMEMNSEEVVDRAMECGFSRMPVYGSSPDDVKGFLYVKDLVKYLRDDIKDFDWHKHIRKVYFVPGSKKISDLLEEFRQKKIHIAIVVDEYGGTDGIVTLEDILEEIVGEISDETDIVE